MQIGDNKRRERQTQINGWTRDQVGIEVVHPHDYRESHYYSIPLLTLANSMNIQRDGTVATLEDVASIDGNLHFLFGTTTYKFHRASIGLGLSTEQQMLYDQAHEESVLTGERLSRGIALSARIMTSDGHVIVSKRNDSDEFQPSRVGIVGGVFNPDEVAEFFGPELAYDPFALIVMELHEEMGLWNEIIGEDRSQQENSSGLEIILQENSLLLADVLDRSNPTNIPVIIFDVQLNFTYEELQLTFSQRNNNELQSIITIEEATTLVNGVKATPATSAAFPDIFPPIDNPTSIIE